MRYSSLVKHAQSARLIQSWQKNLQFEMLVLKTCIEFTYIFYKINYATVLSPNLKSESKCQFYKGVNEYVSWPYSLIQALNNPRIFFNQQKKTLKQPQILKMQFKILVKKLQIIWILFFNDKYLQHWHVFIGRLFPAGFRSRCFRKPVSNTAELERKLPQWWN